MSALYDELIAGPLSTELSPLIAARNDTGIAEVMNRKDISIYGIISTNDFAIWAASKGLRAIIQDHAENAVSPLRSIALTLLDLLAGNLERALDFGNTTNVAMLDAWATAGAITESQRNELLAIAQKTISRADQLGGVSVSQISDALNAGGM
jgi:hypothetical protein